GKTCAQLRFAFVPTIRHGCSLSPLTCSRGRHQKLASVAVVQAHRQRLLLAKQPVKIKSKLDRSSGKGYSFMVTSFFFSEWCAAIKRGLV
ncbi:MAG: hypothetical protein LIO58_07405, partial [Oscillospiraceae bacterium]|nr:hypothetical protein [Oscillospiraceae bacterium]